MTELLPFFDIRYLALPLLGGIGVAIVAGPLGAVMVWKRLAYFSDTLSHSGLLGVIFAFTLHINVSLGVCLIALFVASLLLKLKTKAFLSSDTLLGLLSHTMLALGLLALALREDLRVDILSFLYGDILAMSWVDIFWVYMGGLIVFTTLFFIWQSLLQTIVHKELAQVEGVNVQRTQMIYVLLLAIVVAIAIKMVGVLLITALLIIPAACARSLSKSPEQMAALASVIGVLSVITGIFLSHFWDLPTGPAIVLMAAGFFIISHVLSISRTTNTY